MDKRGRVLVVHYDETIRTAIQSDLLKERFEVDVVQSGTEAIEKSKTQAYSVAVIDLNLPGVNAAHFLGVMKQTDPRMRKIVIVSATESQRPFEDATTDYVIRPPDLNQLLKAIRDRLLKKDGATIYEEKVLSEFAESEIIDSESERDL
jgi:two-component system copper resistance phosphate regulon response regulator CusR